MKYQEFAREIRKVQVPRSYAQLSLNEKNRSESNCSIFLDTARHDAGDRLRRGWHGISGRVEKGWPDDDPVAGSFGLGFPRKGRW